MLSDEEEIDVMDSASDNDVKDIIIQPTPTSTVIQSTVSARTDGIRGKRYKDFDVKSTQESGELTDSEVDVVGEDTNIENIADSIIVSKEDICVLDEGITFTSTPEICQQEVAKQPPSKPGVMQEVAKQPPYKPGVTKQLTSEFKPEVKNTEDIYGIMSLIKVERLDEACPKDGIEKLMFDHRQTNPIEIDSSEEESVTKDESDSSSSDDAVRDKAMSITSDTTRMSNLDIKDHSENREVYPEVEITDLTLAATEEILSLGRIYKIVDDFVVIKCYDSQKILDLDSMIFDDKRKCVGYIFEVLGLVTDPYYSVHFNTNSDILSLGLHLNQDLYYSSNEKYARYVLVDMLRELEHKRRRVVCESDGESEESSDGDKPTENTPKQNARKRKSHEQGGKVLNRTTINYSVNYTSSIPKQAKFNNRSLPLQRNYKPQNSYQSQTSMYSNPPPFINAPRPQTFPSYSQPTPQPMHPPNCTSYSQPTPQPMHPPNCPSYSQPTPQPMHPGQGYRPYKPPNSFSQLNNSTHSFAPFMKDSRNSENSKNNDNFKNSVLSSFLDPFSLDKQSE